MRYSPFGSHRRFWMGLFTLGMLVLLAGAGCAKKAPPRVSPPPVTVAVVEKKDIPLEIPTIGTVNPIESVTIHAQVGGYVSKIYFREGQEVAEGQLLYLLDPRPFDAEQKVSEATLEQTRTQLQNAELQLHRGEDLFKRKLIAQQDLDNLRTAAQSLRAGAAAQTAALDRARLDRQFAEIRAPFAGRMGRWLVFTGDLVQVSATAMAVLNKMRPIDVQFSIPEKELPLVRQAMAAGETKVTASPTEAGGEPDAGELIFVDNAVDPRTGSIVLKARFSNLTEKLWPGEYVDVVLRFGVRRGALVVPSAAIQTGQQGDYVYVIDAERKATMRKIKTGPTYGDLTVVENGLNEHETVVTDGQIRLAPGVKVEINKPAPGPESAR